MNARPSLDDMADAALGAAPDRATIDAADSEGRPRKQADVLLDIGRQHDLFHGADGNAYVLVGVAVYAVDSTTYKEVLASAFLDLTDKGPNRNALNDAITTLCSVAKFKGDERKVWLRTGYHDNGIVIDVGRRDWRMMEVTVSGWSWCASPPMFKRPRALGELPEPKSADFSRLWRYVNVAAEHRVLIAAWLLAALRPSGPYPILFLVGEQGTGKSMATRVLRRVVDPSASLLRSPPKDVRDLLVGALNGWVLALDNLSFLGPELSDALCRISTGGAISERQLYTNADEVLIEVQRPCVVNGIEDLATRPDLCERGLHVELELIENRRDESGFLRDLEADLPHIFSGLLAGLSAALKNHERIVIDRLPRMADFAKWAASGIAPLGFTADEFIAAYRSNLNIGMGAGVDSSPVGRALVDFVGRRGQWEGTAADLLSALSIGTDESTTRSPSWPKSPRGLSGVLRRLAPALRLQGVDVETSRNAQSRTIQLCSRAIQPSQPSFASQRGAGDDANDANDGCSPELHSAEAYRRASRGGL